MNKQSFFDYYFESTYISLHLWRVYGQELLNNTRAGRATIFKLNDVASPGADLEIKAPPEFILGIPSINEVSDLRVKFIKYTANPRVSETN